MSSFVSADAKFDALPALLAASGAQITYSELRDIISRSSDKLRNFVEPQQVVSLLYPNSIDFAVLFLALTSHAVSAAPLNPKYTSKEIDFFVRDAQSKALFVDSEFHDLSSLLELARRLQLPVYQCVFDWNARDLNIITIYSPLSLPPMPRVLRDTQPDDIVLILYTSGTTSTPKCVPLTFKNISRTTENIINTYHLTHHDRSLVVMPLFHVHGLIGCMLSTLVSFHNYVLADLVCRDLEGPSLLCPFLHRNSGKCFTSNNARGIQLSRLYIRCF